MITGFFDLSHFNEDELKQFYRDALSVSEKSNVQILKSWTRELYDEITPADYIEKHITLNTHNVCIDRSIQFSIDLIGEIGSSTYDSPSLFLYIFVDIATLYKLIEKYKLKHKFL